MEKEFVPYELAVKLKELGFDEPCFGFYTEEYKSLIKNFCKYPINLPTKPFLAPTFSQAFRWFREKYGLFGKIYVVNFGADEYSFNIYDLYKEEYKYENFIGAGVSYSGTFDTYEEAELACLDKLIELTFKSE